MWTHLIGSVQVDDVQFLAVADGQLVGDLVGQALCHLLSHVLEHPSIMGHQRIGVLLHPVRTLRHLRLDFLQ